MTVDEIVSWLRTNVDPTPDLLGRNAYRCSAYLKDGAYLPCVLMRETNVPMDSVKERFQEAYQSGSTGLGSQIPELDRSILSSFATSDNEVDIHEIERVEHSPFAIPAARLAEIEGETAMSWTAFAGVMDDGKEFSFGTTWYAEFFELPPGYTAGQIVKIIPHRNETEPVYSEKPFLDCFIDRVTFGEWKRALR